MIVGKGLIASAFHEFSGNDDIIIFASGVSNSKETNPEAFKRERVLLEGSLIKRKTLIYFSTTSILDPSAKETAYVVHKQHMEELIQKSKTDFIIFRLPIVVGKSTNNHTLTNFLHHHISVEKAFNLHLKSSRYLIDIDTIKEILPNIIKNTNYYNKTINVTVSDKIAIKDLVSLFEKTIKKTAIYTEVNNGSSYTINNTLLADFLTENNYTFSEDYYKSVIEKYYATTKKY